MDTGPTKQMEDICREQSCHHSRRNSFSIMETCAICPILLISSQEEFSPHYFNIHTMVEGTKMAYTGAILLACNIGQYYHRTPGSEKCACLHFDNLRKTSQKDFQGQANSSDLLHTADDSCTTAGIPRPSKPPLCPHKILTRL